MKASREEILDYVLRTIEELAHDWDYSSPVTPDSLLFTELGLESLDVVVLGTAIQEHYRFHMPFAEFLADLGRDQRDVSIAGLVDFVNKHLNADVGEAQPVTRSDQ
jgi:acyl carrier protein